MPRLQGNLKLFSLILHKVITDDTVRLSLMKKRFIWGNNHHDILTVPMEVDGQLLNLAADTGSDKTFVISNHSLCNGNVCEGSIFGLYRCNQSYCDGESMEVFFQDGRFVDIVHRKGEVKLDDQEVSGIEFGIVKNYTSPGLPPHSSLGLGLTDSKDFDPILDQLFMKGIIKSMEFSIYFDHENADEGELLLGGSDSTKYDGQLFPVPLIDHDDWEVTLENLRINNTNIIEAAYPILFDTGTVFLGCPKKVYDAITARIEETVRAAGGELKLYKMGSVSFLKCEDRTYLPTLELVLEGLHHEDSLTLFIPQERYVTELPGGDRCVLLILEIPFDLGRLVVGATLLRDYYLNFNKDKRQIYIAKTAQTSHPKRSLGRRPTHGKISSSV